LDAIASEDGTHLKEELGDLLLQIVFHARIAEEQGRFTIKDVLAVLNEKLVRRHPHVFGEKEIRTAEEQTVHWERLKKQEGKTSVLDGVPKTAPALVRAYRIQQKASTVGFDWETGSQAWQKVKEEIRELDAEIATGETEKIREEFGDLLFALVNTARFIQVHPEDALASAVDKFIHRFRKLEDVFRDRGKAMEECTLEELDAVWNEVKADR
jgi:XTP/dITP diphosphohydrolase